jgi:tight adherence protein C
VTALLSSVDAASIATLAGVAAAVVFARTAPRATPRAESATRRLDEPTPTRAHRPPAFVRISGVVPLVGIATFLVGGWWLVVVALGAWPLARALRRRRRRRLAALAADAALPGAIEVLVLTIRAGHVPAAAIATAATVTSGPAREAFEAVEFRMGRGEPFELALGAIAEHLGPGAGPVVDVVASAHRSGSPLAPTLDALAREAREVRRRQAAADARTLPVRLSFPLVLCTLPAFALLTVVPVLLATWSRLAPTP